MTKEEKQALLKEYEDFCVEAWANAHLHGFGDNEYLRRERGLSQKIREEVGAEEEYSACRRGRNRWRRDVLPKQGNGCLERYRDPEYAKD